MSLTLRSICLFIATILTEEYKTKATHKKYEVGKNKRFCHNPQGKLLLSFPSNQQKQPTGKEKKQQEEKTSQ